MHIHIVGIGGTFMAGIASIAKDMGYRVTGCDKKLYPPMSEVLQAKGIDVAFGYDDLPDEQPDCYVVGNVGKRGMPIIEKILQQRLPFNSGPQWLFENVLRSKRVVALAGTHGKTTTSSLMAWVLECCGEQPSFLIGGAPNNFDCSARLTGGSFFVIEADEYDTAFFDKRSKFVHYHPEIAVINNIEFDHADIFASLTDIQKQFHGMLRLVPQNGCIVYPSSNQSIDELIAMGTWAHLQAIGGKHELHSKLLSDDGCNFEIWQGNKYLTAINWGLLGEHNVANALVVVAVSLQLNLPIEMVTKAINSFTGVKRRMELKFEQDGVKIFDDFAHHPTAIATSINGLKNNLRGKPLTIILEFGSFTMKSGLMFDRILEILKQEEAVYLLNAPSQLQGSYKNIHNANSLQELMNKLNTQKNGIKNILVMSNTGNEVLHNELRQVFA